MVLQAKRMKISVVNFKVFIACYTKKSCVLNEKTGAGLKELCKMLMIFLPKDFITNTCFHSQF